MPAFTWPMILDFAGGIVQLALAILDAVESRGCTVDGCPADVRALPRERAPDLGSDWDATMAALAEEGSGIHRKP